MKKAFCVMLAVMLIMTGISFSSAEEAMGLGAYIETVESVEAITLPVYIRSTGYVKDIELLILNGLYDIPYVSLDTMVALFNEDRLADYLEDFPDYSLTVTDEGSGLVCVARDNGAMMVIDTDMATVSFTDANLFARMPGAANGLDVNHVIPDDPEYEVTLYRTGSRLYRERSTLEYRLNDYDIFMYVQDGTVYLPLQTFSDIMLSQLNMFALYNRQCVIITGGIAARAYADKELIWKYAWEDETQSEEEQALDREVFEDLMAAVGSGTPFDLARLYFAGESHEKSLEFSVFCYNELCMALDNNYGLKEEHRIDSFDSFLKETGIAEAILNEDAWYTYTALKDMINTYLADGHSGVRTLSCITEYTKERYIAEKANGNEQYDTLRDEYDSLRNGYYTDGVPGYEEVGNTAIITFNSFNLGDSIPAYYSMEITNNSRDTIELLIYANRRINREDSPVEKVVIDISVNGGGYMPAAACLISWIAGYGDFRLEDTITGTQAIVRHEFDVNLDHVIDEQDCLLTANPNIKRVYCLISSCSFSCANLVPATLKGNPYVTIMGKTSGGGASVVQLLSTAAGDTFQISSAKRVSTVKNGTFYSVDEGVTPDIYIDDMAHLYDREYLVNMINRLD